VVDIRWYVDNQTSGLYNSYANSTFVYDEFGRYLPSPKRFPSSVNGAGFKPLAEYIHAKGLKFGIHLMRGVPRVAVEKRLPVKNANGKTAADIYTTALQCTWLQDNYTILKSKQGAQEYYNSLFELYASWGVDFVKIDDLSRPYHTDEIEMIRAAIDRCGRRIVLSMSPGETPVGEFKHVKSHANMWRTVDDFWDNWAQLNYQFQVCNKWSPYGSPGNWPDADMLPLGRLAIRGERGSDRQSNFTKDEQYTLMTLWSIFRSPLMFGGHLPSNTAFTNSLITNREVLQVNQASVNNRQLYNSGDKVAWVADDPYTGDTYLALFNNGGDGFVSTSKLIYRSGTISKLTDGYGVNIDEALPADSKSLYLIVNDGGDGFTSDHADWINPTIYKANGDSLRLTTLQPLSATSGWDVVKVNKSLDNNSLKVNGVTYTNGYGVNANSIIRFALPEGYTHFKSFVGFDDEVVNAPNGVSVEFLVYTSDPTIVPKLPVVVDLPSLGYTNQCLIRDLWAQKDTGVFSGNQFIPLISNHGAGLYRLTGINRTDSTEVTLSASMVQAFSTDSIHFDLQVRYTDTTPGTPSGSIVVYRNDTVAGIVPVDENGKEVFTSVG